MPSQCNNAFLFQNHYRNKYLPAYREEFLNEIKPDLKSNYYILDKRKPQSENGKENYLTCRKSDKDVYNYFTNSARNYVDAKYSQDDLSSIASSLQYSEMRTNKSIINGRCRCQREIISNECNQCKYDQQEIAECLPDDLRLCSSCLNRTICTRCMREICSKCRKRKKPKVVHDDHQIYTMWSTAARERSGDVAAASITTKSVRRHPILYDENESDRELDVDLVSPVVIKRNSVLYSLFHPSRNANESKLSASVKNDHVFVEKDAHDDFEEIRRITNEKMSKYGKTVDHLPLPSILELENRPTGRNTTLLATYLRNSPAFKMLEQLELDESELDV